jgi:hypothetical protein
MAVSTCHKREAENVQRYACHPTFSAAAGNGIASTNADIGMDDADDEKDDYADELDNPSPGDSFGREKAGSASVAPPAPAASSRPQRGYRGSSPLGSFNTRTKARPSLLADTSLGSLLPCTRSWPGEHYLDNACVELHAHDRHGNNVTRCIGPL